MDALTTPYVDSAMMGALAKPSSLPGGRANASHAELRQTAHDFAAMFMGEMLKPMFEGLEVDGMFGGGHGEEMMRGMMTQEYGKSLAAGSGSDLSEAILGELVRMQAAAQAGG